MEIPKVVPPEIKSIYNEDAEAHSPAMTEILIAQLESNDRALEEEQVIFLDTKPGPKPPAAPPPPSGGTIRKGGATIKGK